MFCVKCGTKLAESDNTCPNCGFVNVDSSEAVYNSMEAPLQSEPQPQTNNQPVPQYPQPQYSQPGGYQQTYYRPPQYTYTVNQDPVTTGEWFVLPLWNLIPIVGSLVYLILLFVWAFGSGAKPSKRNWARAQLIWALVGLGLFVIIIIILVAVGVSFTYELEKAFSNW